MAFQGNLLRSGLDAVTSPNVQMYSSFNGSVAKIGIGRILAPRSRRILDQIAIPLERSFRNWWNVPRIGIIGVNEVSKKMAKTLKLAAINENDKAGPIERQRRGDRNESQTVLRACEVLKAFQYRGEELCLADVTERTGLPKTTAFRLLRTLIHGGLLERAGSGVYRNSFRPLSARPYRIGFATQGDTPFAQEVQKSIELACARENLQLIKVDNRYSAREALRNADLLIKEQVDLVLEFQTYERVAPVVAAKFLEANTPVIAIEVPHPGATYFGANNCKAGLIAGLRITGFADGLRAELPEVGNLPAVHLNGRGDFEQVLETMRQFLRRAKARRENRQSATRVTGPDQACTSSALGSNVLERAVKRTLIGMMCARWRRCEHLRKWEPLIKSPSRVRIASPKFRAELRRPGTPLIGTVAYFPELYGEEIIPLALGILAKKTLAPAVFVKHQLVTPRNVDLIYPLDERGPGTSRGGSAAADGSLKQSLQWFSTSFARTVGCLDHRNSLKADSELRLLPHKAGHLSGPQIMCSETARDHRRRPSASLG